MDTGRKLNIHKTFRRRPGCLLNVLCTFNIRFVSTGLLSSYLIKSVSKIFNYFLSLEDRPEIFPLCHYDWSRLYQIFVRKHGGIKPMQNYVLKRCFRNRQALEEHYKLSLHASRRQKWYKYLEDRDVGNREALKALTVHMPKVTYIYMLHQVI